MIAIRITHRAHVGEATPIDEHGEPVGEPVPVEVLLPEGFEVAPHRVVLTEPPVADRDQIAFVEDDDCDEDDARRLRPGDVPRRWDLPEGHPLRGKRALAVVPAGWVDATVDAHGRLTPIDLQTGEPIAEPAEVGAGDLGAAEAPL